MFLDSCGFVFANLQLHHGLAPNKHGDWFKSYVKISSSSNALIITTLRFQSFAMMHHLNYSKTSRIGCFLSQRSHKIFEPFKETFSSIYYDQRGVGISSSFFS